VTLSSGEKQRIPVEDGVQPSWSPHGLRIAYWAVAGKGRIEGQRDIYTIPAVGGVPVAVTSDTAVDWNPVWSPDGRYLYFSSNRGGSMNLWRVGIDESSGQTSGEPEAVTTPSSFTGHLSVSADGRHIASASLGQTAAVQKVAFDPDAGTIAGAPVSVLSGSRFLSHVAPSPDGQWLLCYVIGNQLDILLSRSDGSGERELTHDSANDRNPTWSPNGSPIAFFSNRSGLNQIWSIRPDGSELRQLTFDPQGVSSYDIWSPDGSHMVYAGQGTDHDQMFVFEPHKPWQEQTPQRFSRRIEPGRMFLPISWSPDGTQLLGDGVPDGTFVYTLASGQFSRLLARGVSHVWLRDGRRVLVTDQRRLLVHDIAAKTTRELLSIAPDDFDSVAISADNRTIYFTRATLLGDIWLTTFK
jgi:eukaryotic-like serine/threonine-protein kinase